MRGSDAYELDPDALSIRGIPVRVHASWLAVYGLIAWGLAVGYFPQTLPELLVGAVMQYLVLVNVAVGVFNLFPGFPLDGGRVLRAALWKAKGDLAWATRIASMAGSIFGLTLIVLGVWRALAGEFLGGLWFVVIGFFLRRASTASYPQLVVRRALGGRAVADAMTREVVHVPPDLTVETFRSSTATASPAI